MCIPDVLLLLRNNVCFENLFNFNDAQVSIFGSNLGWNDVSLSTVFLLKVNQELDKPQN